jgi:hypothetical protein
MKKTIKIVSSPEGDWQAVYVNNKVVYQNHSVDTSDLIRLGLIPDIEYCGEVDETWMEDRPEFPKNFKNIKFVEMD